MKRYRVERGSVVHFVYASDANSVCVRLRLAGVHGRLIVRQAASPWEF
jgi:hypothetical protein